MFLIKIKEKDKPTLSCFTFYLFYLKITKKQKYIKHKRNDIICCRELTRF